MTNQEIKDECESLFKKIKNSQDRLAEIRKICKHEHTFLGTWSWRVGCYNEANICSYCGNLVSYVDSYEIPTVITTHSNSDEKLIIDKQK